MNTETIISYGIGRRKQAIAQVILKLGNGTLTINKISHKDLDNDIKAMKVGELREMAINEKKLSEEQVKAMRKPDLVNLLTNE